MEPVVPEKPKRNRRHDNRVAAMQFLYIWESQRPADTVVAMHDFVLMQEHPREYYAFAEELVQERIVGVDRARALAVALDDRELVAQLARLGREQEECGESELHRRSSVPRARASASSR